MIYHTVASASLPSLIDKAIQSTGTVRKSLDGKTAILKFSGNMPKALEKTEYLTHDEALNLVHSKEWEIDD